MPALAPDLLNLSDAAGLRRLFAALGYDPQEQISYSARTMDWPENVAADLRGRSFELLADTDAGFFQVLLLEPQKDYAGLTQALTQRLFATLEQRGNDAILVLPSVGWGTLELVLLADLRPLDARKGPPSFLRFSFDPRAPRPHQLVALELLDVQAAGPGEASEIVARAFRRAQQERFFRSVNFFSTYYLEQRIASDPALSVGATWAGLLGQMPALRAGLDVADARASLAALGWTVAPGGPGAPERLRAGGRDQALVAILPPDHSLDQPISAQSYPQIELIAALEQERQAGGLAWAILTNGRSWRLYSHLTASISGAFYEVELGDLLSYGSDDELRYLAGFFGPAGLASQFAGAVFASSQTLARDVGENLKQVVFNEVFKLLANAIADDLKRSGEYDGSEAQRQLIFRTTLILLYRMLFVLYAESMRLLPTMHAPYYAHSLTFLISDIALQPFTASHLRKPMTDDAYWAWEHLRALFGAISAGRPDWGVPKYNGGLFSDGAAPAGGRPNEHKAPHRLLARLRLGAMDLGKALDLLGRDPQARAAKSLDAARRLIDYAGLDVRRLGSIYEGLLEFQLVEDSQGDLELKHTRAERKASGSYYTPDYIVAYIVEQAVGPVLDERARQFAALMERLPAARRDLERATRAEGNQRVSIATAKANSDAARKAVEELEHAAVESLLDLKILDPAMGSGHFLVSAVNFVTDRLIVILNRHREGNPILARLDGIRQQIRASLREQGVDGLISDEQLNNVNLLRRLVMKRCVFGVDLNDMAVELARLSLWLNSFTVGAPLNFLDHHLKWGNSLIGARVQAVQRAMEGKSVADVGTQLDMFTSGSAFAEMLNLAGFIEELVEIADANAQQVEQSEALYAAYEQSVVPVKRLLDLWVSQGFGSKEANQLIRLYTGGRSEVVALVDALMGRRTLDPASQKGVEQARELFQHHRFLHWDLDFPEVFIDLRKKTWKPVEQMGFDAIVGNPPYDELMEGTRKQSDELVAYFSQDKVLSVSLGYRPNLYRLFVVQSLNILHQNAWHSFIVPLSLLGDQFALGTRRELLSAAQLHCIELFPQKDDAENRIFEEAKISTCLYVAQKRTSDRKVLIRTHPGKTIEKTASSYWAYQSEFNEFDPNNLTIPGFGQDSWSLLLRLAKAHSTFGTLIKASRGELMINKEFTPYLTGPTNGEEIIRGSHVGRYELVQPKQGESLYLHREKYLKNHKIDSKASHYTRTRLIYQRYAAIDNYRRLIAAILPKGYFCSHTVGYFSEVQSLDLHFLLGLLNSRLLDWRFTITSTNNNVNAYEIESLPLPSISFTTPEAQRAALASEAQALYERGPLRAIEMAAPGPAAGRPPTRSGESDRAGGRSAEGSQEVISITTAGATWRQWRTHWAELWAWADARLPRLADGAPDTASEQSDAVHDLLALLAERMIALHRQKQADAAALTGWLEQETGSAVEDWALKTVVQSFWEQPWEEIERALQKNRSKFMQTAGLRGKQADAALEPLLRAARGRWATAVATLTPTLAAITATDRLIDLLVYRLYGLTDEEIDLVEGG